MYVKIALISHWNDFCLTTLRKCAFLEETYLLINAKHQNFEFFESALYMKSGNMSFMNIHNLYLDQSFCEMKQ